VEETRGSRMAVGKLQSVAWKLHGVVTCGVSTSHRESWHLTRDLPSPSAGSVGGFVTNGTVFSHS
jgi:hypothetical protein